MRRLGLRFMFISVEEAVAMLYVSNVNIEGKIACVRDTDDGEETNISFAALKKIIKIGVEVQGAYLDTNGLNIHKIPTSTELAKYLALRGKSWREFVYVDIGKSVIVSIPNSVNEVEVQPGGSIFEYLVYRANSADWSKPFIFDNLILVGGSGLRSCGSMFWYMQHIKSIDVSNLNTSNVLDMSNMFGCCKELRQVNLHGVNTKCVKSMRDQFAGCGNLTTLDLSSFDTRKVKDFSCMFGDCMKLEYLNFPGITMRKDTSVIGMFSHCSHKTALIRSLPVSVHGKFHDILSRF